MNRSVSSPSGIHKAPVAFEALESRVLFDGSPDAPVADVQVSVVEEELINEDVTFAITFDNTGATEGYAPYVDFIAPAALQIQSATTFGAGATNPSGSAVIPVGRIAADGQLVDITTGVPMDHPMYAGASDGGTFGRAGSGTSPVLYDVAGNPNLAGMYVYSAQLPFGSYTPGNPEATVYFTGSLDKANGIIPHEEVVTYAAGGFAYGADALHNPVTDTPISATFASASVTPLVIDLMKTAIVPEEDGVYTGENVSGPNHPITYRLTVNLADGEEVNNLVIRDLLPDDLAYTGNVTVTFGGGTGGSRSISIQAEPELNTDGLTAVDPADNELRIVVDHIVGQGGGDIVVTYTTFVPYREASGQLVVDSVTGEEGDLDADEYNDASVTATYDADGAGPAASYLIGDDEGPMQPGTALRGFNTDTDYRIEEHSLAIQKGVDFAPGGDRAASGVSQGDVLEYRMNFQISDYFAFDEVVIDDLLGDGQEFLPGDGRIGFGADVLEILPELAFTMHGATVTLSFDSANFEATENPDGTTAIRFDVYQQLVDSGFITAGAPLLGGFVATTGTAAADLSPGNFNAGATTGTVMFRARVRDAYENDFITDPRINQGDVLRNSVTITGRNLDIETFAPLAVVTDGSAASITVPVGQATKELHSVTHAGTIIPASGLEAGRQVVPGDVVTWRLTYTLPISEFEVLTVTDYLPLPIFDVSLMDTTQVHGWDPGTFNTAGRISFGPGDTFFGADGAGVTGDGGIDDAPGYLAPGAPIITLNPSHNSFTIQFVEYIIPEGVDPVATTIEIYVSTLILDGLYADGLLFTNQVEVREQNSNVVAVATNQIAQIDLTVPELEITKGIVAAASPNNGSFSAVTGPAGVTFNAPGSGAAFTGTVTSSGLATSPIDANISGIDAGDVVTFAITLENTGSGTFGAFDVRISDTLPAGFLMPGASGAVPLNLRVTDGTGAALAYNILGGGTDEDFFLSGLELIDPSLAEGSIAEYDLASGQNVVIIAYDLVLADGVEAASSHTNTATLENYSYREGGTDYSNAEDLDSAIVSVLQPTIAKRVVDTSHDDTSNVDIAGGGGVDQVAVGEVVTYEVTVTVPEGQMTNFRLRDTLGTGMAFLALDSVTASAGLSSSLGAWSSVAGIVSGGSAGSANEGTVLELGFGTTAGLGNVINSNRDNTVGETITIRYRAVVTNVNTNDRGDVLGNTATLTWQVSGVDQTQSAVDSVTVVEPRITLTKDASASSAEGDDVVTYTIVVRNGNQANVSEAYDLVLEDLLPDGVSYVGGLTHVAGVAPDTGTLLFDSGAGTDGAVRAVFTRLGRNQSSTLSFQVRVDNGLNIGTLVSNTASVTYTSLPGSPSSSTPHNAFGAERTGDPSGVGGAANDYRVTDPADFTVVSPVSLSKAVVDTSEDHTGVDATSLGTVRAAVGEVVRFAVTFEVPQANSPSVELVDTLDSRLFWLDPAQNNIQIRFDGFAADGSTLGVTGDLTGANGTTITLDPSRISFDSANNRVTFSLGDILNTELDTDAAETITILYNAVVRNSASVDRGDVLVNSAQLRTNGANVGSPLTASVTVVEPVLTVTKSDNGVTTADAGDLVDYRLRVSASSDANTATAFDLLLTDSVPAGLEIMSGTLVFDGLPAYISSSSVSATGQDITASVNELRPGDFFDILFQIRVRDSGPDLLQAGERIQNTAQLTYSSLPDDGTDNGTAGNTTGSESGSPGSASGERSYNTSGSDFFDAPVPVFSKVLANPADTTYTIGETVEYVMTLTLPEGRTGGPEAYIFDTVDAGFSFVAGSLSVVLGTGIDVGVGGTLDEANSSFFTRVDAGVTLAESLRFDFGYLDYNHGSAGDGLATQTVEIRYRLSVDNILLNQSGQTRNNVADFFYTDDDGSTRNLASDVTGDTDTRITIVEPVVSVGKQITSIAAHPDAGDAVGYQLVIEHTGITHPHNVAAYDVTVRDVLPVNLSLEIATFTATLNGSTDVSSWFSVSSTGLQAVAGSIDLNPGDRIVITYGATISTAVRDGDTFLNEVDIEWSSLDGVIAGERSGDGDLDNPVGASNPNDYEAADTASFVADLNPIYLVTKEVIATSASHTGSTNGISSTLTDLAIGETVTYRVTATVGRGTTENLRLVDALDITNGRLHIRSVSYSAGKALSLASGNPIEGLTPALSDSVGGDGYTDRVEVNFGTVINDPSLYVNPQDEQIILIVEAVVVNDSANQQGDVIRNTGTLYFDDETGQRSLNASVDVEIVEPDLDVIKTIAHAPATPEAGDVISYEIQVRNTGSADAFDASFADVIPTGMNLLPDSFAAVRVSDSFDVSSWFTVTATGIAAAGPFHLAAGDTLTLTYNTSILTLVTDGTRLTNDSNVTWTSLDASDPADGSDAGDSEERTGSGTGPNDYLDGDSATLVVDLVPTILKTVHTTSAGHTGSGQGDPSLTDLVIGEVVTYELVAQLGRGTSHGVVIEDSLDLSQGILHIRSVRVEIGDALTATVPAALYTDSNLDGFLDQVRLDFGTVVNEHSLSTGAQDEQIRVYIEAEVRNVLANQSGDVITNTGRLILLEDTNGDGFASESVTRSSFVAVEIVEPHVTAAKTVLSVPASPDAGDLVRYEVVLENSGGATAFDIAFRDVTPSGLALLPDSFTATLNGSTDVSAWFEATASGLTATTAFPLAISDRVVITYDAAIQTSVRDGQRLTNSVAVEWTSLSSADPDDGFDADDTEERGGNGDLATTSDPSNPNDYESAAEATVTTNLSPLYAFTKTLLSSSEGHTAGAQLVIGETVTYELVAQIGRGTTGGVVIEDLLALTDGILDIRAVRVELGVAINAAIPTPVLIDSNSDGFDDQVRLDFGTVVNDPGLSTGVASEQIRVYIDAVVVNVLANQGGDVIANTGRLTVLEDTDNDGDADDAVVRTSSVDVELVEPVVTVAKTIPSGTTQVDAGDTVGYRLVISNTSPIDAFDLTLRDQLPAQLTLLTGTFTATRTSDGADVSSLFAVTAAGVTRAGDGFGLSAGDSVVITYDAAVLPTVTNGLVLNTQADIEWTTIEGATADERTGDGDFDAAVDPSNPDDQENRSHIAVTTELTPLYGFTTSVFSTSEGHTAGAQLVIGETVTYELVAQFGRGTTVGVVIEDVLALTNGILDIRAVRVELGAAINATIPAPDLTDSNSDGFVDQVRLEFGTVVNNPALSTGSASEQIRVYIDAVVVNVLANQGGDVITNTGRLTLLEDTDGDGQADNAVVRNAETDVEIVEPELTIGKTIAAQPANPDAGDTVSYEVVITNTSAIDAFDISFRDALPANVGLQVGSFVALRSSDGADVSSFFSLNATGVGADAIVQAGGGFTLAAGDVITVRYDVVIRATIQDGSRETNRAGLEWTTTEGDNADERGGDGDYENSVLPGNPNDHEAGAETTFTANLTGYGFEKTVLSTSHAHTTAGGHDPAITDLTIGETVVYELRATFAEGTTTGVIFTDVFEVTQGILQPVSITVSGGNNLSFTVDPAAISTFDDNGDGFDERIVVNLGAVVNDAGDILDPEADQLVVLIHAQVVNVVENRSGDQIVNEASFTYAEDSNDDGIIDGSDSPVELRDDAVVELVEPVVSVTKTVDDAMPRLGQVLTYTLTLSNGGASTADAFDIDILDRLAEGLVLDLSSIQIIHLGAPVHPAVIQLDDSGPGQVRLTLDRLDQGDSVLIVYQAAVTTEISFHNAVLSNDVDIEWTSLPGAESGERGGDGDPDGVADPFSNPDFYEHGDLETVEVFQPDLTVIKDDEGARVRPGQPITYTMTLTNQGRSTALGVTLTDDIGVYLDQGFRFLEASDGGLRSGDIVTWNLPDLAVGDTVEVTLTLRAPAVLPAGVERVTNTAVVTHQDIDPTPDNNQEDETSPVLAWPDLTVSKDDALAEATVGDLVTYTISFDNVGNQVASGVVITDTLPPGVQFVSASDGGSYREGQVVWNFTELAPHAGGSVQVTVRVLTAGLKVNNVLIEDDGRGGLDPTPDNNEDSDETLARQGLRFDLNQNFLFGGGSLQRPGFGQDNWRDQLARLFPWNGAIRDSQVPLVLATHMNSGLAQPGSTITLEVYNARGERIAEQSVVADTGGNWLATFNTRQLDEAPSRIVMRQTWAAPNPMMQQGYNYRTYFAPAFSTATYYTEERTVWNVTEKRAATEVLDLYDSCECILQMDWNHTTYEFHARGALQSSSGN